MKKLLLTLTVATVSAFTIYGQGRVNFQNESTFAAADAITVTNGAAFQGANGGAGGDGIGGDKYSVQLRWAAGSFANQALFDAASPTNSAIFTGSVFLASTGPLATFSGFFDAGIVQIGAVGSYTMQALAWYSSGGAASYAAARGANGINAGRSALFTVNVTAAPSPVNATVFPGFVVWANPVPEPSTFALAGLGAAALLLIRRRK